MEGGDSRRNGRSETDFNEKGAIYVLSTVRDYLPTGRGSESKPWPQFFRNAGCLLGERCRLSHSVAGGFNPSAGDDPNYGGGKSLLCYKLYTDEGCDDNCPYAHGPEELRDPIYMKITDDMGPLPVCSFAEGLGPKTCFGASIKTIRSFCSPRSSTEGMDTWLWSRMSGAKISFKDHESDPSMLIVNIEGMLYGVELATNMVRDHVASVGPADAPPPAFALPPNSHAICYNISSHTSGQ